LSRRARPQVVEVYYPGESTKFPSKIRVPYEEAERAFAEGRAIFRDHRRKIVMAVRPYEPSTSRPSSSSLNEHDVDALIGAMGYVSRKQSERLEAWGFQVSPKSENPLPGGLR
jgi:hypothetical protein